MLFENGGEVRLDHVVVVSAVVERVVRRLSHMPTHSEDSNAACSNTVRVAFSCLSGG